ncbi:putative integrase core domain protein, partial [Trichinella spiralis]|uniref:putative integrase core domain protein n=1 Tax=Trichinella spiralis TaxID=6334 RepID=UPI0001EFBD98
MLGHIEEFDISKPKEWTAYASRLIFFLEANNVTDPAKRRAVLLSSCGGAVFNLIQALISPASPNEKSFDEILFVLKEHFSPQPSEIVKRNAFYKRNLKIGKSISDFVADLRWLAEGCNFSDLEIMLRDRLHTANSLASVDKLASRFPDSLLLNNLRASAKRDQSCTSSRKIRVTVVIENFPCETEIDTGSEYTILSEYVFRKLSQERKIQLETITLELATFQGELVKVKESCSVNVQYGNIHRTLTLIVAKGHCPNLLGFNWFEPLGIYLSGVHHLTSTPPQISEVLRKYRSVFTEELGMYVGKPVSLDLDPNVTPICMKARKVPFALREKIDAELDKLVEQGVLEPVDHPVWSTPIVTPVKPDGTVRICGDYKCTINKALRKHAYPIPAVNQLLASLSGGKVFAKLDLAQAFQQLTVDDATADAQTIITHRGAFRVKRLQFGISAAPGVFQNVIDKTVAGIQGVLPYFNDILIAASDEKELANHLETVLHRFAKAGLRLKSDKCKFCLPRVEFLGFEVDATGIHPAKAKVQAIQDAPEFYAKYTTNQSVKRHVFDEYSGSTPLLSSDAVLTHYDGKKPLVLVCDASPHGTGAVLCHKLSSTQEIPIAFYSRTLSATERNYAQIDKEALAVIAGVKKFHEYLYGGQFTIITDHKPLLGVFVPKKETPQILSPRMLRWSILLIAYDYTINYRPGKEIANADARGWLKSVSDERLKPYVTRQHEISIHNGCLLWGSRVIIPLQARHKILKELHIGHPGIVRWWPKMDSEIENLVRTCEQCQQSRASPPHAPVHKWESPRTPWSRIHVDLAGPIYGKNFLIVVDAFSKWREVRVLKNTTSESVISCLRQIFSTHGLPDIIVSDNGTQFTSHTFQEYLNKGGIRHITSASFHPSSNGQDERM